MRKLGGSNETRSPILNPRRIAAFLNGGGARFELAAHEVGAGFQVRISPRQISQDPKAVKTTALFLDGFCPSSHWPYLPHLSDFTYLLTAVGLSLCYSVNLFVIG
jgi:hypothetical protein